MKTIKYLSASALSLSLIACGGGGGSSEPADTTAPTVSAQSVSQNQKGVALNQPITITLSEGIRAEDVNANNVQLQGQWMPSNHWFVYELGSGNRNLLPMRTVDADITYNKVNHTITITPKVTLHPLGYYQLNLKNLHDAAGNPISETRTTFFTSNTIWKRSFSKDCIWRGSVEQTATAENNCVLAYDNVGNNTVVSTANDNTYGLPLYEKYSNDTYTFHRYNSEGLQSAIAYDQPTNTLADNSTAWRPISYTKNSSGQIERVTGSSSWGTWQRDLTWANGQVNTVMWPNGLINSFSYDTLGRISSKTIREGSCSITDTATYTGNSYGYNVWTYASVLSICSSAWIYREMHTSQFDRNGYLSQYDSVRSYAENWQNNAPKQGSWVSIQRNIITLKP